jgi:DNA polymerase-3 subunit gamma/tau
VSQKPYLWLSGRFLVAKKICPFGTLSTGAVEIRQELIARQKMYYTKYRPQKFSEILKPNDAASALATQVKEGKTAHAYLFIGSRGTGKTTAARILAKALNCTNLLKAGDPCCRCSNCKQVQNGSFMDLIEIDAASNRGIDDIRSLRDKIKLAPTGGLQKVYIIDEVHMLTTEAFNALLKTLEEPPEHATFVLCTTESHKVPETIKSRCQVFNFKRATVDQLVAKLKLICKAEGVKVSAGDKRTKTTVVNEADLKKIALAAHGGYRDAETMLQQIVEGSLDVDSFVSHQAEVSYAEFVGFLLTCDVNSALGLVNGLFDKGFDLHAWSIGLLNYLRDLLFISAQAHEGLVDVSNEVFAQMEEQACKFDSARLVEVIEAFVRASSEIKGSTIPQLPLELAVVGLCTEPVERPSVVSSVGPGAPNPDVGSGKPPVAKTITVESAGAEVTPTEDPSISEISEKWNEVIKEAKPFNHSVHALLKSTKPVNISGGYLVLEVYYAFHKERLESNKNREIVEKVVYTVYGHPMRVKCILSKEKPQNLKKGESGTLTDYNVQVPASEGGLEGDAVLDFFDGGLPM